MGRITGHAPTHFFFKKNNINLKKYIKNHFKKIVYFFKIYLKNLNISKNESRIEAGLRFKSSKNIIELEKYIIIKSNKNTTRIDLKIKKSPPISLTHPSRGFVANAINN
ncbi:TPA: hypothetical protein KR271_003785 [Clostridioides difficile]|nr:hypothetical protein [Clostridioides difficile]